MPRVRRHHDAEWLLLSMHELWIDEWLQLIFQVSKPKTQRPSSKDRHEKETPGSALGPAQFL